jgi:hypothetical protein
MRSASSARLSAVHFSAGFAKRLLRSSAAARRGLRMQRGPSTAAGTGWHQRHESCCTDSAYTAITPSVVVYGIHDAGLVSSAGNCRNQSSASSSLMTVLRPIFLARNRPCLISTKARVRPIAYLAQKVSILIARCGTLSNCSITEGCCSFRPISAPDWWRPGLFVRGRQWLPKYQGTR